MASSATVHQLSQAVYLAAALITVILGVGALFFRPIKRFFSKFGQFLDDWSGEPARPGVEERPGVMTRLQKIEKQQIAAEKRTAAVLADLDVRLGEAQDQLAQVHHETQPNGGWSMKDQLNRLDPALPTLPPRTERPPLEGPS